MRAAKVQASLRIRAVSPEPPLLAHTSSESRRTVRQKARSLAPLNGWACAVKICHDGILEDTNSLDGAYLLTPEGMECILMRLHKLSYLDDVLRTGTSIQTSRPKGNDLSPESYMPRRSNMVFSAIKIGNTKVQSPLSPNFEHM